MAKRKHPWEIGLANLLAAYEQARADLQRDQDDFNAVVAASMTRPPTPDDLRLADAVAAYDELEFALLRSL